MFSGIVEQMAQVVRIDVDQTNKHFTLRNPYPATMGIDQSIAHNGVCLTVVSNQQSTINNQQCETYTVTAMQETLRLTNLDLLQVGDYVNLERAMSMEKLLDGHIVQGHVDCRAICVEVRETEGSWYYRFCYDSTPDMIRRGYFCVDKGSVTINGVSLTACEPDVIDGKGYVSVCIIPYTHEVTNFQYLKVGSVVNIEFDIIGKYLARMNQLLNKI